MKKLELFQHFCPNIFQSADHCLKQTPMWSKIEVLKDVRNSESPDTWQVQESMVSILEQMQVPNGTGPGVQGSNNKMLDLGETMYRPRG